MTYPEPRLAQISKDYNTNIADGLVRYLDEHPEVNRVFWRGGGRPNTQRQMRHHGNKFVGNYTYNDDFDIMSKVPDFPSDVWRMIEMKTVEPLGQVERAEVSDPRGAPSASTCRQRRPRPGPRRPTCRATCTWSRPRRAGISLTRGSTIRPSSRNGSRRCSKGSGVIASTNKRGDPSPPGDRGARRPIAEIKGGGLYGELFLSCCTTILACTT